MSKLIKNSLKDWKIVFLSIVSMLSALLFYNPYSNAVWTTWDRTFCGTTLFGINILKQFANVNILFFAIPILFMIFVLLYSKFLYNRDNIKDLFVSIYLVLLFIILYFDFIKYNPNNVFDIRKIVFAGLILMIEPILCYILLVDNKNKFSNTDYYLFIFIYISILFSNNFFYGQKLNEILAFNSKSLSESLILCFNIVSASVFTIVLISVKRIFINSRFFKIVECALFYFLLSCFFLKFSIEILYILISFGMHIADVFIPTVFLSIFLYCIYFCIINHFKFNLNKISFFIFFIGILFSLHIKSKYNISWEYQSYADLYENANFAVVFDTIFYGKFPIIDYFSSHAMSDYFTRLILSIFTKQVDILFSDPLSIFLTLINYCLFLLFLIKFVKLDFNFTILFLVIAPIWGMSKSIGICFIEVFILLLILKNDNIKYLILFFISSLFFAFYSYDEGVSFGITCIILYVSIKLFKKEYRKTLKFIICGSIIGLGFLLLLILLYNFDISKLISRILEWVGLSLQSHTTWGRYNFGKSEMNGFVYIYYFLPIFNMLIFMRTIYNIFRVNKIDNEYILILFFSIFYILNFNRTITWHNLASGELAGFFLMYMPIALYILIKKEIKLRNAYNQIDGKNLFIISYAILIVLYFITCESTFNMQQTLIGKWYVDKVRCISTDFNTDNFTLKNRYEFQGETKETVEDFRFIFDNLLLDDETFIDSANITSIYPLVKRQRPFYVCQSPTSLTTLNTQDKYLDEINVYDCPLLILGINNKPHLQSMDGIPFNIRYYKLFEKFFNDYRPFIKYKDFAIWCDKSVYSKYLNLYNKNFDKTKYTIIDFGYDKLNTDGYNYFHKFDYKEIPYMWANLDEFNAISNKKIFEFNIDSANNNVFLFDNSNFIDNIKSCYLHICIDNNNLESARMVLEDSRDTDISILYSFNLHNGINDYIFRISSDSFWANGNINSIKILDNVKIKKMDIIQGD